MKIRPIKQRDASACGPTSIQMVLKYLKIPHTYKKIAEISQYKKRGGLFNKNLVDTLRAFDLIVQEKANAAWSNLIRLTTPNKVIIVSWMKFGYIGHFSVVEKVDKDYITLADPDSDKYSRIEKIKFMRLWMDYDEVRGWYPIKNTDIQLRWMCIVSKKDKKKT